MKRVLGTSVLALLLASAPAVALAGEYDCVTEPSEVVELRAAVEGLIESISVERGDPVKAGEVVVQLDAGLEQANAELARFRATMTGAIRSAESRLEYTELKSERSSQLAEERFVSAEIRDEALTEQRMAEAQLLEIRDNQQVAELEYRARARAAAPALVLAPIDGIVVERSPARRARRQGRHAPADPEGGQRQYVLHVEALLPLEAYREVQVGQRADGPAGGPDRRAASMPRSRWSTGWWTRPAAPSGCGWNCPIRTTRSRQA
jgi:multidrug efflux pump subunit AcrA (membrane-fusion protein)